jgi:flagellar biogenesis protein FliO
MNPRLIPIFVLLALLLASIAAAGERDDRGLPGVAVTRPEFAPPSPPTLGAPGVTPTPPLGEGGPSLLGALARLLGAVIVIAVLMAGCVLGYRRLSERGTRSGVLAWATGWTDEHSLDAVRVASRRSLGGRESVAVIHAGGERFLVGITTGQVSLIARLEQPVAEPLPDFTEALTRATTPREHGDEAPSAGDQLRAAVERSRERLGRLAHLSVVTRDGRG